MAIQSFMNPLGQKFFKALGNKKLTAKVHEGEIRFKPDFGSSGNKIVTIYNPFCPIEEVGVYEVTLNDGWDSGEKDKRGYKIFIQSVTIIKKL